MSSEGSTGRRLDFILFYSNHDWQQNSKLNRKSPDDMLKFGSGLWINSTRSKWAPETLMKFTTQLRQLHTCNEVAAMFHLNTTFPQAMTRKDLPWMLSHVMFPI